MLAEALRDVLLTSTAITDELATYEFTTSSPEPAIFTTDVVPENADFPAVIINEVQGGIVFGGTRAKKGAEPAAQVRFLGDKDRNSTKIRSLAWVAWRLLSRSEPTDDVFKIFRVVADPPQLLDDEDGFPTWIIIIRAAAIEK